MKLEFKSANGGDVRSLGKLSVSGDSWMIEDAPDAGAFESLEKIAKDADEPSADELRFLYAKFQGSMFWAEVVDATQAERDACEATLKKWTELLSGASDDQKKSGMDEKFEGLGYHQASGEELTRGQDPLKEGMDRGEGAHTPDEPRLDKGWTSVSYLRPIK